MKQKKLVNFFKTINLFKLAMYHESYKLTNRLIEARWFRMREAPPKNRVNQISSHVAVKV